MVTQSKVLLLFVAVATVMYMVFVPYRTALSRASRQKYYHEQELVPRHSHKRDRHVWNRPQAHGDDKDLEDEEEEANRGRRGSVGGKSRNDDDEDDDGALKAQSKSPRDDRAKPASVNSRSERRDAKRNVAASAPTGGTKFDESDEDPDHDDDDDEGPDVHGDDDDESSDGDGAAKSRKSGTDRDPMDDSSDADEDKTSSSSGSACDVDKQAADQVTYYRSNGNEFRPDAGHYIAHKFKKAFGHISETEIIVDVGSGAGNAAVELVEPLCESMTARRNVGAGTNQVGDGSDQEPIEDKDAKCPSLYMIEPLATVHANLERWSTVHGFPSNNLHLVRAAFSDADGDPVTLDQAASSTSGIVPKKSVVGQRLDTWLAVNKMADGPIAILNIDASGYVPHVLRGASGALRMGRIPFILFSYGPRWAEVDPLSTLRMTVEMLDGFGYDTFVVGDKELLQINGRLWNDLYQGPGHLLRLLALVRIKSSFRTRFLADYNIQIRLCAASS